MTSKRNLCEHCPNNCCGNKFVGLANALKENDMESEFYSIQLSEKEAQKIEEKYANFNLIEHTKNGKFLKLNKDHSCKAYANGICQIYDARPDVCKLYPFYFDPFCGICVDKNCPCFDKVDGNDKKEIYELLKKRIKFFEKIDKK